jgi:hypothetical protein
MGMNAHQAIDGAKLELVMSRPRFRVIKALGELNFSW